MEYKSSYERIDNFKDIDYISKEICKDYNLGNFFKSEIIDTGYEDFNYFLYTEDNKYVVKVFNTERDNTSCQRVIDILLTSYDNGVPVPKIFKCNDKYIYEVEKNDTKLKLFVMEYAGVDFWELNKTINNHELEEVAKIASRINSINYNISETFYDEWTVTNLCAEYEKKKKCLSSEDYSIISKIVNDFSKLDFTKFKYAYVHGDIIKANLLIDENDKIYLIDFSDFNYLPRIVELNAILCGLCSADTKEKTLEKMNYFLSCYNEFNQLDEYEIEKIPLFINALASMYVIQSSFIRENSGDYTENDYWYQEGKRLLGMNINDKDINIK